ncbi:MAG: sugar phosphate isomerase/epimerase family protein [Phycisphaerae bacterium]|jgi:sugar phosphate isomerase/epimerase
MITLSAFADEIDPSLKIQMDVCASHGIGCIDVRGIDNTNVSKMTLDQVRRYRKQMDDRGFRVPCVGSPLGKIKIGEDFQPHLELLRHCCDVAKAFGTSLIRIFSFYPPEGGNIADHRSAVMDQLAAMVKLAEKSDVILLHENEKAIYGAKPAGVLDIFATVKSPALQGCYDPANYVEEGIAPYDQGWKAGLDKITHYFHIKDKNPTENTCVPAGKGQGQIEEVFRELKTRNWSGIMTLEPHMQAAGQFQGFTGPDLFAQAVGGLKGLLDRVGLPYQ